MLFKRRKNPNFWGRVRLLLWPRRSFYRSIQYYVKRTLRLRATPHAIAAGIAAGVFISFTPFLGFHFIGAALIAWMIGGNLLASAIGTAVGNPLTLPFILAATMFVGKAILHAGGGEVGAPTVVDISHRLARLEFSQLWDPLIKPMLIGAFPLGLGAALIFYFLTWYTIIAFRQQKRKGVVEREAGPSGKKKRWQVNDTRAG